MPKVEEKQRNEDLRQTIPPSVLVVDDDPFVREILTTALMADGKVSVTSFARGDEAVRAAPDIQPDLILLDVLMPGLDGAQTWTALCEVLNQEPEVIFLTAKDQTDAIALVGEEYGSRIISKPFDPLTIVDQIRHVLKQRDEKKLSSPSRVAHVKKKFRQSLVEQADALDAAYAQFKNGQVAPGAVNALHERVHKLAGTAGLFKFEAISDIANDLERLISDYLQTDQTSPSTITSALLNGIRVLATECRRQV